MKATTWSCRAVLLPIVGVASLSCGCALEQANRHPNELTSELADLHFQIAGFWLHLDTARDAIDLERATVAYCDPEATSESYQTINHRLGRLIQRAEAEHDAQGIIANLRNVQTSWSELRMRQTSRWAQTSGLSGVEPQERCMRPSGLADLRLEVESNIRDALKENLRDAM